MVYTNSHIPNKYSIELRVAREFDLTLNISTICRVKPTNVEDFDLQDPEPSLSLSEPEIN